MSTIHSLTMPKWGLSMKEGKVVGWLVDEGAAISAGEEVLEIETEKILSALESPVSGIVRRKVANAGDVVAVAGMLGVVADASVPQEEIDAFIADFRVRDETVQDVPDSGTPTPEYIDIEGRSIRYLKLGQGSPAAVLLHGFGGDINSWLFNHQELSQSRIVYALDLPGHGGSSKNVRTGSLSDFAAVLKLFMDALGLATAHLVGHSLGGAVALQFAAAHPERCASLVLIASAGLGREIDNGYLEGFVTASRRKDLKPHLEKLFADSKLLGRQLVEDILKYKRLDGVEAALRTTAGQFCQGGEQAVIFRDQLTDFGVPILSVWGAADQIIPLKHSEGLPTHVITKVISGSGHMVHMEAATKVNHLIQNFWRQIDENSSSIA
jgi:pyruvate dehydrogenase E2 component (dihydrolipoyllysine-residue acetyltransferase)